MKDSELNLATLSEIFADEDKARAFLESKLWPDGEPVCPHCANKGAYKLTPKPGSKRPVRKGVWKCKSCRKQFTVRVGTIFEDSKIPLRKWLMAIHLMTSSKKGVSSHQIARECGITVKSAWFLNHRIREAMRKEPMVSMLGGAGKVVEADEGYFGARRPRRKGTSKRGRGTSKKPVAVLVERGGNAHAQPIHKPDKKSLNKIIRETVDFDSSLSTDEWQSYNDIGRKFKGGHFKVNHGQDEYVRYTDGGPVYVSTNSAESFIALMKRGHMGIFHHLSHRHLHRYCNEFSFRWNHRKKTDGQRMVAAIKGAEGKRLYYRQPVGKNENGGVADG